MGEFPITFRLVAEDNATGAFQSLVNVMNEGKLASEGTIDRFKEMRSSTALQMSALRTLGNEWKINNLGLYTAGQALSSLGSVTRIGTSLVTSFALAQLALASNQARIASDIQAAKDAQMLWNQMIAQFGPNSKEALDAMTAFHTAQSTLARDTASLQNQPWYQAANWINLGTGIATAVGSIITSLPQWAKFVAVIAAKVGLQGADAAATAADAAAQGVFAAAVETEMAELPGLDAELASGAAAQSAFGFAGLGAAGGIAAVGIAAGAAIGAALALGGAVAFSVGWLITATVSGKNLGTAHDELIAKLHTGIPVIDSLGIAIVNVATGWVFLGQKAYEGLQSVWNAATWFGGQVRSSLAASWKSIQADASAMWSAIGHAVGAAINFIIDVVDGWIQGLNLVISAINRVASIAGFSLPFVPLIPHVNLGTGGIVTSPTFALLGERGPEVVQPLSSASFGGGGNLIIQMTIQGSVVTENQLVDNINRKLVTHGYYLRRRR